MTRKEKLLRILPLVLLLTAALARAQEPTTKYSFTLPAETRWAGMALVPGDYTFVISHDPMAASVLQLRHEGRFVGHVLMGPGGDANFENSSIVLEKSGSAYAVKELRLGQVGVFTYNLPKPKMERIASSETAISIRSGK
jgi:hypothetical protein